MNPKLSARFFEAIESKSSTLLSSVLYDFRKDESEWKYGWSDQTVEIFNYLLLSTWYQYHEDIIQDIDWYVPDGRFVKALVLIAENPGEYRRYDLELESGLRKCFHALIQIDTQESRDAVQKLIDSKNENVLAIVNNYKATEMRLKDSYKLGLWNRLISILKL